MYPLSKSRQGLGSPPSLEGSAVVVAGAIPSPPSFLAYDSGLPSAPKECLCQMGRQTWEHTPEAPRNWHLARGASGRGLLELTGDTHATWLGGRGEVREGFLEEVALGLIIEG